MFLDPRDGQLARFCAEPWFPVELFKRMRWKPYCATWNCFTWNTMNPKHITSQEVTWTTSGSYRFHLISWHLPSKSKPLRASRADAKHLKHRLLNANAKPLQLQESGLRTHKTTAFEFVWICTCRIMCICLFGGLEPSSTNYLLVPIWLCDATAGTAEPRCLEEVWRNYLFLAMKLLSLSKKSCWLHSVVFGLTR